MVLANDPGDFTLRLTEDGPPLEPQYNIIFVCDICLEEIIISNRDFNPYNPELMDTGGWFIPPLIGGTEGIPHEVTASSVVCYCPRHNPSKPVSCPQCFGELTKKKDVGEGVKHCKECGCGWFILKTSQPKRDQ